MCRKIMLKDASCCTIILRNITLHLTENIFHRPGSSLPSMIPMMFVIFLFSNSFLTSNLTFLEKKKKGVIVDSFSGASTFIYSSSDLVFFGYRSLTNFLLVFHILVQFCR